VDAARGRRWRATIVVLAVLLLGIGLALGGVGAAAPDRAPEGPAPSQSPSPAPVAAVVQQIPEAPVRGRGGASAVWTGEEMIVWGGTFGDEFRPEDATVPTIAWQNAADGAAYDLAEGTWRTIAPAPLEGRSGHVAVWTGQEMLVWGGLAHDGDGQPTDRDDGAAYDPATDTWRPLPPAPVPGRGGAAAVWTGQGLLLVGGARGDEAGFRQDAAAYDPAVDSWRPVPVPPLGITEEMPASWSGRFVNASLHRVGDRIVLFAEGSAPNWAEDRGAMAAASWDPAANDWMLLDEPDLEPGPYAAAVVDRDLVVTAIDESALGALGEDPRPPQGLPAARRLDGDTGEWTDFPQPSHRSEETIGLIGLDGQILAVMGEYEADDGEHVAVLELDAGGWTPFPAWPTPRRRVPALTSTGEEILVWSGHDTTFDGPTLADGFTFHP